MPRTLASQYTPLGPVLFFIFALAVALFSCDAIPAYAATRPATPLTFAAVDALAQPGDVVRLAPGVYPAAPNPLVSRVTYIGDPADPTRVQFPGTIVFRRDSITVRGVSAAGGVSIVGALRGDSLVASILTDPAGSIYLGQAQDAVIADNTISVRDLRMECLNADCKNGARPRGVRIQRNRITLDFTAGPGTPMFMLGLTDCLLEGNRWTQFIRTGVPGDAHFRMMYHWNGTVLRDNRWTLRNENPDRRYAFAIRDSGRFITMERDTILEDTSAPGFAGLYLAASGSLPGTCGYNTFRDLHVRVRGEGMAYQNATNRDTIAGCSVVSGRSNAFLGLAATDSTAFLGSLFQSLAPKTYRGAYRQEGARPTSRVIRGCAFVVDSVTSIPGEYAVCYYTDQFTGLEQDGNTYWARSGAGAAGRAIGFGALTYSGVGPSTPWAIATGQDLHSRFAEPSVAPPPPPPPVVDRTPPAIAGGPYR
jgi:hypothetical protein